MGIYSRLIFPYVCDLTLNQSEVAELRTSLLADVDGAILEIGLGTGLNLPCYPKTVRKITTIDPNTGMGRLAEKRSRQSGVIVDHHRVRGEQLPFEAGRFDYVVSTFTLCSIDDVERAITEVHRVLKLGGKFLFLEHGLSPEANVQKWQHRLNRLQGFIGDGCRLIRDIPALVVGRPFANLTCDRFYLKGAPRTHGYLFKGMAVK